MPLKLPFRGEAETAEAASSKPNAMATLNLKSIKKIYPHSGGQKKPKKGRKIPLRLAVRQCGDLPQCP